MNKKIYGVKKIKESLGVEVLGLKQEVKLSWWEGMEGAISVFDNKENAMVYAEGREELIFKMEYKK